MFNVPFFHLLWHTHIRFGHGFPPEFPSLMLAYRLQCVDSYGVSTFRNLLFQNRNLLCKVTIFKKIEKRLQFFWKLFSEGVILHGFPGIPRVLRGRY